MERWAAADHPVASPACTVRTEPPFGAFFIGAQSRLCSQSHSRRAGRHGTGGVEIFHFALPDRFTRIVEPSGRAGGSRFRTGRGQGQIGLRADRRKVFRIVGREPRERFGLLQGFANCPGGKIRGAGGAMLAPEGHGDGGGPPKIDVLNDLVVGEPRGTRRGYRAMRRRCDRP